MRRLITSLLAAAVCAAVQAALNTQTIDGGTALIVTGTAYTQEETDALNNNTVTELWKTGNATLVSSGIASFTGIIRVKGGIMQVAAQAGLGTKAGATYVESGATLDQTSNDAQLGEPVFLEGIGAGGVGAYYASDDTAGKTPGLSGKVTLTGDALLGGVRQWYLSCSELDMNGHTLTTSSDYHQCVFKPALITNPGHFIVTKGTMWINNKTVLDHGPEHTITVTNDARVSLYWYTDPTSYANWTLRWMTTSTSAQALYVNVQNASVWTRWHGPVEIPAGYFLTIGNADNSWIDFWGPISGGGDFRSGANYLTSGIRFYGTNTFTGAIGPIYGQYWFMHRKALPTTNPANYATLGTYGKVYLPLRPDGSAETFLGWTVADIEELYDAFSGQTALPLVLNIASNETFTYTRDFTAAKNYSFPFTYSGGGTVKFTGDFIGRPTLALYSDIFDGTKLVIDGSVGANRLNQYGAINFYTGVFRLENMGYWYTSTNETLGLPPFNVSLRGTSPKTRLTFGAGTAMGQKLQKSTEGFNIAYWNMSDPGYGTLELLDGCAFTNRIAGGYNKQEVAAIYQRGGDVYLTNGGGNDGYFAQSGYFFYEKSGGTLAARGYTRLGQQRAGCGVIYSKGDWKLEGDSLVISAGGTGVVYQTAGTFWSDSATSAALTICNGYYAGSKTSGHGNLTVRGDEACVAITNGGMYMADTSLSRSFVNLMDGGTLWVPQVKKQGTASYVDKLDISNAYAYVNFDGGVLKAAKKGQNIFGEDEKAPDRVTVFGKGAVIDSSDFTVTNNVSLQAPTGKGVASIAFPAGFDATEYMGPPIVTIVGDGEGATAVCEFDSVNQVVTGITVTSPGWGYTTATASLSRGGKTTVTACTVTLADNATTGGLTKRGSGTLVLSAANTYGGPTRVEAGTLVAANASALPSGSSIVIAGGTLALESGVSAPNEITVDLTGYDAEGGTRSWTLLTVADGTLTAPVVHGLEGGWLAKCSGRNLLLRRVRGTVVSIR